MSILDTFSIVFESNAEQVAEAEEKAAQAGKQLEDQLGATGTAGTEAAGEIAAANADAAASFADVASAAGEANAAMGDSAAGVSKAADAHKELGVAVATTGETGASAFDKIREHGEQAAQRQHEMAEGAAILKHIMHDTGEEGAKSLDHITEHAEHTASAFDHVKHHAAEMAEQLIEHAFEVAAAFKALFEVEKLVDNFFEQAERSDQLGEKARSLGVQVEDLDAWGQAVKHVGGSSEAFEQSLSTVNMNLERIAITGHSRMLPFLKQLHIGLKDASGAAKTSFELLAEIPEAIEKMPKAKSGAILRGIGLDEGTIRLMQAGGKEAEELVKRAKELGVVTMEDAEVAEKFNREWMDVKQLFRSFVIDGDTAILPMFGEILHAVEDFVMFLKEHKSLVTGFLIAITAGAIYAAEAFGVLDFAIGILTSPITLVVAAVAALITLFAFLYDDIVNFAEGNDSVIGELAKKWPIVGEAVHGLIAIFEEVRDAIVGTFEDIISYIKRIPEGFAQWEEIFAHIGEMLSEFGEFVAGLFEGLPEDAQGAMGALNEIINGAFEIIKEIFVGGFEAINIAVNAMYEVIKAVFRLIGDIVVDPLHAFQNFGTAISNIVGEVVAAMPHITEAFDGVGKAFDAIGHGIIRLWESIGEIISGTIGKVGSALGAVGNWLGKAGNMVAHPASWVSGGQADSSQPDGTHGDVEHVQGGIADAKQHLSETNSPLMAQTPASLSAGASRGDTNNTVNVTAPTTINTQSTDAAGIKQEFDKHMDGHLESAINHFADGVSH